MLTDVVQRYQNRSVEAAQVVEELVQMAKVFREAVAREQQFGLTKDEMRFYEVLANNESAVRKLTDETLKKIAHELEQAKVLGQAWASPMGARVIASVLWRRVLPQFRHRIVQFGKVAALQGVSLTLQLERSMHRRQGQQFNRNVPVVDLVPAT
jgi:type I restriction enzyme R subunit